MKRFYGKTRAGSHVVCFDEFGPIELRPFHGSTWARRKKPDRLPATYSRPNGVRHFLAFYDVHQDVLWGYVRSRKRWQETLEVMQRMRRRYPKNEQIFLVLDNFSPHKRKEVRRWARKNLVTLVWTPTNASWLNRIECQFTELKKFVFENTYYKSHMECRKAINDFLLYRNKRNKKRKNINLKRH
ncbi:MAG: IS630 family transposase [Ignavibacteria bacterium]|nr:IS630 family transposase [Ignavibacteria bacterium]